MKTRVKNIKPQEVTKGGERSVRYKGSDGKFHDFSAKLPEEEVNAVIDDRFEILKKQNDEISVAFYKQDDPDSPYVLPTVMRSAEIAHKELEDKLKIDDDDNSLVRYERGSDIYKMKRHSPLKIGQNGAPPTLADVFLYLVEETDDPQNPGETIETEKFFYIDGDGGQHRIEASDIFNFYKTGDLSRKIAYYYAVEGNLVLGSFGDYNGVDDIFFFHAGRFWIEVSNRGISIAD